MSSNDARVFTLGDERPAQPEGPGASGVPGGQSWSPARGRRPIETTELRQAKYQRRFSTLLAGRAKASA